MNETTKRTHIHTQTNKQTNKWHLKWEQKKNLKTSGPAYQSLCLLLTTFLLLDNLLNLFLVVKELEQFEIKLSVNLKEDKTGHVSARLYTCSSTESLSSDSEKHKRKKNWKFGGGGHKTKARTTSCWIFLYFSASSFSMRASLLSRVNAWAAKSTVTEYRRLSSKDHSH